MKAFKSQGVLKEVVSGEKVSKLTLTAIQNGRATYTTVLALPEVAAVAETLVGQAVEVKGGLSFRKQEDPTRNPVSLFANSLRGIEGNVVCHTSKAGNTAEYLDDGGSEAYLEGNLVADPDGNDKHANATLAVNHKEETHYFDLIAFGDQVAALGAFPKGARIKVRGNIEHIKWVRSGQTFHRTRVVVAEVQNARLTSSLPPRAGGEAVKAVLQGRLAMPKAQPAKEVAQPAGKPKKKGPIDFGSFPV